MQAIGPVEQTGSALDVAISGDGFFTTDVEIGEDVSELFNYLTGYSRPHRFRRRRW